MDQQSSFDQIASAKMNWPDCRDILLLITDRFLRADSTLPDIIACADEISDVSEILLWLEAEYQLKVNASDGAEWQECFYNCVKNLAENWPEAKIIDLAKANPHFRLMITPHSDGKGHQIRKVGCVLYGRQSCQVFNTYKPEKHDLETSIGRTIDKLSLQLAVLALTASANSHGRRDQICGQFLTSAMEQQQKIARCPDAIKDRLRDRQEVLEANILLFVQSIKLEHQVEIIIKHQDAFAEIQTLPYHLTEILIKNNSLPAAIKLVRAALKFHQTWKIH